VQPKDVFDVLRGIWSVTKGDPPLSNHELMVGMALIARYELDPFAREIYVTRNKGRLMTILGVDAWVKILNRTEHYDGFDQILQESPDGSLESVETVIYSKRRKHPAKYRAYAREYAKLGGFVAKQIPDHMLRLFSLRHAARLFVPLGGCVTEEEAQWMAAGDRGQVESTTLDDLADRIAVEPVEVGVPIDVAHDLEEDRARLADEWAGELRRRGERGESIPDILTAIEVDVTAGRLTRKQGAELNELAKGAAKLPTAAKSK